MFLCSFPHSIYDFVLIDCFPQELLEEKISTLVEANEKKKVEIDSIRKQLSAVTREKRHYEQQYMKCRTELDRKV